MEEPDVSISSSRGEEDEEQTSFAAEKLAVICTSLQYHKLSTDVLCKTSAIDVVNER
jgi:hypothetical protein